MVHKVFIVGDVRIYREGLAYVLRERNDTEVLGTAASLEQASALLGSLEPGVILVDVAMRDSLNVVGQLRVLAPSSKIIALTLPERGKAVVACAEAGVDGYVTRDSSVDDLLLVIASVHRGELPCSPRVAASLLRRVSSLADRTPGKLDCLTPREMDVLRRIEKGLSNKEISAELGIEVPTVKNHVHRLLDKLGVRRRGEAAAMLRRAHSNERSPQRPEWARQLF